MQEILQKLEQVENLQDLEALRVETIGRKGFLTQQFATLKALQGEAKKAFAAELNTYKESFESLLANKKNTILVSNERAAC